MKKNKHPLILALEHKQRAIKNKAHPRIVEQIDKEIKRIAEEVRERWSEDPPHEHFNKEE